MSPRARKIFRIIFYSVFVLGILAIIFSLIVIFTNWLDKPFMSIIIDRIGRSEYKKTGPKTWMEFDDNTKTLVVRSR